MKRILIIVVIFFQFGCSSVHEVKVLNIKCQEEVDLCVFLIEKTKKNEKKVYELGTFQFDSFSIPIRKIKIGDVVKLKLVKAPKLRISKYKIEEDRFYTNESNESLLIDDSYYSPDIEGKYYIRIR
ncbi:hypothetical protein [Flavobacterium sp.]|uniref:hypothetical protein n=1 Tax=Flavobacterium sp. TaxID=239 RepID=UPI002FD9F147